MPGKIYFLLLLLPLHCLAQQEITYPRDTSYTVQSAYNKIHKKYPFVKVVEPNLPEGVECTKDEVYKALGDRKLHLDVFYPDKKRKKGYPGVLLIHGGGWRTGDRSLMVPLAQQLAAKGYVAITVEYRLSLEAPYPAAVYDLKAAVRWMRAKAKDIRLDPDRIAVLGCSAGGQLAALLGTTNDSKELEAEGAFPEYSSNVQAIVDIDGILAFKHPESEEGTMAAQWLGGTYEEAGENWIEASALSHVDQNTPPVLFIGSSYPRFLAGKDDMIKILEKNHIDYETYLIPDSPHSFWLMHPWFKPTLNYITSFLNKVFKK